MDGKFNEMVDFIELVTTAHILAASMHFFGLQSIEDEPRFNTLSQCSTSTMQWPILQHKVEKLVDRYVMVGGLAGQFEDHIKPTETQSHNPHCQRIQLEHNYTHTPEAQTTRRKLPQWLLHSKDEPNAVESAIKNTATDGVLSCSQ